MPSLAVNERGFQVGSHARVCLLVVGSAGVLAGGERGREFREIVCDDGVGAGAQVPALGDVTAARGRPPRLAPQWGRSTSGFRHNRLRPG